MKIHSFSFQNLKGRPNEDYYLIGKKYPIFAVADGVSRIKNPDESYPKPSGARMAAEKFCKATVEYLKKNYNKADLKTLRRTLNFANRQIFNLNKKQGINQKLDYLENDYFSTCGITGFMKRKTIYFGYAGDCGIRVYDRNNFLKFISVNNVEPLEEWRDNQNFKSRKEYWIVWRKILRNKPKAPHLTCGVFTGEPEVSAYYHLGKIKLNPGDLVFLYSDGFFHFIKKAEFRKLFREYKGKKLEEKIKASIKKEVAKNPKQKTSETFDDDKTLISLLI